jgi:ASPM-SPD-2-Hydin domain-containing protein
MRRAWVAALGLCACGTSGSAAAPDGALAMAGDGPPAVDASPAAGDRPAADLPSPEPLLISPSSKDFGEVDGSDSPRVTFTITNPGGVTATDLALEATGSFKIADGSNRCGPMLDPGASCTVDVVPHIKIRVSGEGANFGRRTGVLIARATGQVATASLEATLVLPEVLDINPSSSIFVAPLGVQSAPASFTVTNTRLATTGALASSLDGTGIGDYLITREGCTAGLAGRASCTVAVAFRPSSRGPGAKVVKLLVSGAAGQFASTFLVGLTTSGDTTIVPVTANFGMVAVGATADQTFTVTNNAAIAIQELMTFAGDGSGVWSVQGNTCPARLPPGGSCTVTVRFAPTAAGDTAAELSVSGNRFGDRGIAVLTGTGR